MDDFCSRRWKFSLSSAAKTPSFRRPPNLLTLLPLLTRDRKKQCHVSGSLEISEAHCVIGMMISKAFFANQAWHCNDYSPTMFYYLFSQNQCLSFCRYPTKITFKILTFSLRKRKIGNFRENEECLSMKTLKWTMFHLWCGLYFILNKDGFWFFAAAKVSAAASKSFVLFSIAANTWDFFVFFFGWHIFFSISFLP